MNNVKVGHCSLFSCAKGHLYVTLRMQELPMMINSDNDHDIEGDDIENCNSEMNEDHNNLKDNCPWFLWREASKTIYCLFFFFLMRVLFFHIEASATSFLK